MADAEELWKFYKATLIFDEEVHVKPTLEGTEIVVNGGHVNNWTMVNSMDEPLVQVSDLIVGLMGKYFVFLDNSITDVEAVVNCFNHIQLSNFQLWQEVLQDSFDYNKSFFEMIVSLEQNHNFFKILEIM